MTPQERDLVVRLETLHEQLKKRPQDLELLQQLNKQVGKVLRMTWAQSVVRGYCDGESPLV
jgi:hypothetical protein